MKKLFTLLAMVGLAFASCTPSETPDGPNGGEQNVLGAGEFAMSVSNITTSTADLKITPKAEGRTYYWDVATKEAMAEFESTAQFMQDFHAKMAQAVKDGLYNWVGDNGLLDEGTIEYTTKSLKPNTEYIFWAFGVDANGNLTSQDLTYVEFQSAVSTFDPASWIGVWTVTSPKTYLQQQNLVTEKYEEALLDEPLTRNIEIVDGTTLDPSLEGYALVYGWDGFFLYDGPAIGVYNDNKIELLNNEIVGEGGGAVYQWLAQSSIPTYGEGMYMVGGDYTAYTLEMDEAGNVAINGYVGTITTGDTFYVETFSIFPVVGEDIYTWKYDEPAYTFAGNEMAAVKAEGELTSLNKLSKKVNVMHKHANAKFNAKHFSAAVQFVK